MLFIVFPAIFGFHLSDNECHILRRKCICFLTLLLTKHVRNTIRYRKVEMTITIKFNKYVQSFHLSTEVNNSSCVLPLSFIGFFSPQNTISKEMRKSMFANESKLLLLTSKQLFRSTLTCGAILIFKFTVV